MANKESYFASLHILMRAILMAQRTLAAGFADTGIEKAAAKSAPAGKYQISVNPVILSNFSSCRSLSAVALAKADVFVAKKNAGRPESEHVRIITYEIINFFCKTKPNS